MLASGLYFSLQTTRTGGVRREGGGKRRNQGNIRGSRCGNERRAGGRGDKEAELNHSRGLHRFQIPSTRPEVGRQLLRVTSRLMKAVECFRVKRKVAMVRGKRRVKRETRREEKRERGDGEASPTRSAAPLPL